MKRNLKKLAKGGIETIIGVVILVAIVIGLFIAVILPMVDQTTSTGNNVATNMNTDAGKWVTGDFTR